MTTSPWSHLPNAPHIDRMLAHLCTYPKRWAAARDAAWAAVRHVARDAARDAVRHVARDAAWGAAWGATITLVAWDDCAYMLDLHPDALQMLIETGDETTRHQAVLLLPAATALSNERTSHD